MLEYDPRHQTIDLYNMREIPLSEPDPEKDTELVKTAEYNLDIQVVLWNGGKPVGGIVWIDAAPHSSRIPNGTRRDANYYKDKYITSFSYNLNYDDFLKNMVYYTTHIKPGLWRYLEPENMIVNGFFPRESTFSIDRTDEFFWWFMKIALSRTPNFDLAYLNYDIPVFLVQGMHMMNPNIAPKPVLDGVLVCRNAQAKAIKSALSPIEVTYNFDRVYKYYNKSCFGSSMPYANLYPDHAFGDGDIVAFHYMCLKLDLALEWLQENKLPFPFIIQLANPDKILHLTKEELAEKVKQNLYETTKGTLSDEQFAKLYNKTIKRWGLQTDLKKPLFKPSKLKIDSLSYCKKYYFWAHGDDIPSQAEVQYLYDQICTFNKGILGQ